VQVGVTASAHSRITFSACTLFDLAAACKAVSSHGDLANNIFFIVFECPPDFRLSSKNAII